MDFLFLFFLLYEIPRTLNQPLPAETEIKTDITFAYEINDMKEVSPSRKKMWSRETHFLKPDL